MMNLEVYNEQNKLVCKLDEDCNLLGSYPLEDNMRLHVGGSDHFEWLLSVHMFAFNMCEKKQMFQLFFRL
jgi:hypothetical protein